MAELKMDFTKMAESFARTAKERGLFVERWIPVSERLPEDDDYKPCIYNIDDGAVLWQDSKGNIGLGWYYNSTGVWADLDDYCPKNKVIAWMPLPEPMQADKENTKMTNGDLFQSIFGIYATELWSKPEAEFLEWLNSECKYPEPKTGHWKRISMDKYSEHAKYWYRCSRCGKDNLGSTDWCPNCGYRMVAPHESEG